jgi:hypothetical protein
MEKINSMTVHILMEPDICYVCDDGLKYAICVDNVEPVNPFGTKKPDRKVFMKLEDDRYDWVDIPVKNLYHDITACVGSLDNYEIPYVSGKAKIDPLDDIEVTEYVCMDEAVNELYAAYWDYVGHMIEIENEVMIKRIEKMYRATYKGKSFITDPEAFRKGLDDVPLFFDKLKKVMD